MPEIAQPSMASGEVTPALYARVDLARYYTGLRTCRNFMVKATGGVVNRPGTILVHSTKDSTKKARLIDFTFNSSQAYVLEFGEYYIRIHYRGAVVTDGVDPIEVTTIFPESVLFDLTVTQNADVMTICHQDYPTQQLGRYAQDDWRITPYLNLNGPFQPINVDTGKNISVDNVLGNITITSDADIFTTEDVGRMIRLEMAPESATPQWQVNSYYWVGTVIKTSAGYYKNVDPDEPLAVSGTVRPDHTEGVGSDGITLWEYLHSGYGIVLITGFTSAKIVTGTVQRRLPDSLVGNTTTKNVTGLVPAVAELPGPPIVPAKDVKVTVTAHGCVNGDIVTISEVTGTTGANGEWAVGYIDANHFYLTGCTDTTAYISGGKMVRTRTAYPTYKWAFEEWGGASGYPACSGYYQQRQIFGGSIERPNAVQMSMSQGFTEFIQSSPLLDSEAITFAMNAGHIGKIQHFVNLKQLIVLTTEGPWLVSKSQGDPIPLTDPQGEGGASVIRPIKVGKQALYCEVKGNAIRSLGYEFTSDTYEGKDLTITADHLFTGLTITDWAFQKVPDRVVWMVRSDGVLIGLTYMVEQEVVAWHRHDTDGFVESVCVVSEETADVLYMSVRRVINGVTKRYVEKLSPRIFSDPLDNYFVDCGLSYDGRTVTASKVWSMTSSDWTYQGSPTFTTTTDTFSGISDIGDAIVVTSQDGTVLRLTIMGYTDARNVTVSPDKTVPADLRSGTGFDFARNTFSGLDHLEGKTVSILADGRVQPQQVVTSGAITIPNAAVRVHIGLPYISDLETLDINSQGQTLQDRVMNVNSVSLMLRETRGILVGPDENNLLETRTEIGGTYDEFYAASSGNVQINVISDWSKGGRVFVRQEDPLPVTILSVIPTVTVAGN